MSQYAKTSVQQDVVKATPGSVRSMYVANYSGSDRWMWFIDATSVPGSPAAALVPVRLPAGTAVVLGNDFFDPSEKATFRSGVCFAISTARLTYAAASSADHDVVINYL